MSTLKPIVLWGHCMGPNPYKVHIILEELNVPFEWRTIDDFSQMKLEPYVSLNPNGRVPAIEDPNTGVKLWESGAIIEYLIEQYDKEHRFSYQDLQQRSEVRQWIAFQISGQGPYYGQLVWFGYFHQEKLQSAVDRYAKEVERVRSVLNTHLSKQAKKYQTDTPWLVGEKITVADLAWLMWETIASFGFSMFDRKFEKEYPTYDGWMERMKSRPSCQKALQMREDGIKKLNIVPPKPGEQK